MFLEDAQIITNTRLVDDFYVLTVKSPKIAAAAKPGQFLNILVSDSTDPLLRRPISIYDADVKEGTIKFLYFLKGKGTNILRDKIAEETISVSGPHGNGFVVSEESKNILLVGGGFGVAPLSFLAKENKDKNIFTVIGGRTKNLIFCEDDFDKHGAKVCVTTDDGSHGVQGLVTVEVERLLRKNKIDEIFSVGPKPMMKAVAEIAKKKDIPCFVSMEERMACGIGNCKGCVCKTKTGYQTVCTDGPIFNAKDLEF